MYRKTAALLSRPVAVYINFLEYRDERDRRGKISPAAHMHTWVITTKFEHNNYFDSICLLAVD